MLPFSMVYEDRKADSLIVMPAYYWLYNMYALERNAWKYHKRDIRKTVVQHIETDYLAPDTAAELLQGIRLLERWTGYAWFIAEHMDSPFPDDAELESKGREVITNTPEVANSLLVTGELMERSNRPVRIVKVVRAWNAYRQMLLYYAVKSIARYLSDYGIQYEYFTAQVPETISLNWVNMGGQLVPEEKVDALRASIRTGLLNSWDEIHDMYEQWWQNYPRDRAENAYEVLRVLTNSTVVSSEQWNELQNQAIEIRKYIEEQVYLTKKKDYTNFYRGITYRNEAERDAVLGTIDDNTFIKAAKEETVAFNAMLSKVKASMSK